MVVEMTEEDDLPSLERFAADRFVHVRRVGKGGNATVFQAWDRHLKRIVAFKTARERTLLGSLSLESFDGLTSSEKHTVIGDFEAEVAFQQRYSLLREGRLLARLDHPNVMPVLEIGLIDRRGVEEVAVLMPFLDGGTLDKRSFTEPWEEVLEVALQIGRGLGAIHREGLLHRDLKPNNILFDADGRPRIADLGLACEPEDAEVMSDWAGTFQYMAPETASQIMRDERDDIYAFCMIVFEMFYGYGPFAEPEDRLTGKVRGGNRQAGMSAELHAIIVRGLALDPDERWPDMRTLLEAMEQTRRPQPRRRWPWMAAGFAAAVALGLVAVPVAQADECEEVIDELAPIFDNEIQAELRGAYGTPKVGAAMKRYATLWVDARARECETAKVDKRKTTPSPCAASTKARFDATLQAFRTPHLRAGLEWGLVVAKLPDPEHCIDHPDDGEWGYGGLLEFTQLDVEIDVYVTVGDLDLAGAKVERLHQLASAENYRHGVARANFWYGEIFRRTGELERATKNVQRAHKQAVEIGAKALEAESLMSLTAIAGAQGDVKAADVYGMLARPAFAVHLPGRLPEVLQVHGLALLDGSGEARERGLALLQEAVEICEGQNKGREPTSAAYENYARGLLAVERPGEALEYLELSEKLHRVEFGYGTWRVHDLLRLKFEARLESEAGATESDWWPILALDSEQEDWAQYVDDALWIADLQEQAGRAVDARRPLRAALGVAAAHGLEEELRLLNSELERLEWEWVEAAPTHSP